MFSAFVYSPIHFTLQAGAAGAAPMSAKSVVKVIELKIPHNRLQVLKFETWEWGEIWKNKPCYYIACELGKVKNSRKVMYNSMLVRNQIYVFKRSGLCLTWTVDTAQFHNNKIHKFLHIFLQEDTSCGLMMDQDTRISQLLSLKLTHCLHAWLKEDPLITWAHSFQMDLHIVWQVLLISFCQVCLFEKFSTPILAVSKMLLKCRRIIKEVRVPKPCKIIKT